ncbi:ABC transporter substrate-binding protein [Roseomonas sp. OT10]|uniref:ABC transporter substrate-binding protein n=1 Tax=Roseomonas cutis TaxID=2897332 RepID=UPI001E5C58E8|nr:ABC transporter substrate-binding protein [Roseomonas sp. OT10]UFN47317.1 ABC transporter substrate-binding protein [Roseomonas sp. OT10]
MSAVAFGRRGLLAAGGTLAAAPLARPGIARAEGAAKRVRFTLDWAFQGPNSYALLGRDKGFFREEGIDLALSRGFGSGRVPVDVAAGTFDMGQGDINPTLKFMAENPSSGLVAVAVAADRSGLCVTAKGDGPIRLPKDLEGRVLCAPDIDAGRQLFPAFARAAGIDMKRTEWLTVRAELREPMLLQGRADAITGIVTSTALSLKALGLDLPQQRILFYRDHGLDLYATCYLTTRDYLAREPGAVRGMLRALFRSLSYTYRHPEEAIAALVKAEPLSEAPIELERYRFNAEQHLVTENVLRNGLSSVDPARLGRGIRAVEEAFGLPPRLRPEDVYTDAYLPPREMRML